MPISRLVAIVAAAAVAAMPGPAVAHAELVSTDPAMGATLDEPPTTVVLTFDDELDPDESSFSVIDADGTEVGTGGVDLEVADRNVLRGDVSIGKDGLYAVEWTAVGRDGHPESGRYEFHVGADSDDPTSPDTALPLRAPLLPAGIALVALATVLGLKAPRGRGRSMPGNPVLVLVASALLTGCVSENRPAACEEPSITIDLELTEDALDPTDPAVCRGQEVTLVVDSQVDGVIHIHGYDAHAPAATVTAGDELRLTFTAERSGQFPIELHPGDEPEGVSVGVFTVHEP